MINGTAVIEFQDLRGRIIDAARRYLGWGWRHQGRGPRHIDCVGLPIMVARDLEMVPHDFNVTGYSKSSQLDQLVRIFQRHMTEKPKTAAEPGDLVVTRDHILPCHCGILGDKHGLSLIHARATISKSRGLHAKGLVREEPYVPDWRDMTTHCFLFPGTG